MVTERNTARDTEGDIEAQGGFAVAGASGQAVDVGLLDQMIDDVVGGCEFGGELAERDYPGPGGRLILRADLGGLDRDVREFPAIKDKRPVSGARRPDPWLLPSVERLQRCLHE